MFNEIENSLKSGRYVYGSATDFCYPAHFHSAYEILHVIDGAVELIIDQKTYVMEKGAYCMIFPNELHEIYTPKQSSIDTIIFSEDLVKDFSSQYSEYSPEDHLFELPDSIWEELLKQFQTRSFFTTKGLLYLACSVFNKNRKYVPKNIDNENLFLKIFSFIEENYNKDCSLEALSKEISYNYSYLSKYFNANMACSFADYVNRYRLKKACYLLKSTTETVSSIAYLCGFGSIRSFNRAFKENFGKSPTSFRDMKIV